MPASSLDRVAGALLLSVGLLLVSTAPARADGLTTISYGDDCWGGGSDADADGLADGCEQELAYWFMPAMWFDSGESGYGRRPHYAAKSLSFATRTIQVFFMATYYDDTGIISGHDGDPEFQVAEVHYSNGRWYLDWMYMSAHRKSWCDSSSWYHYSQLEFDTASDPNNAYRGWPTIYVAEDKHATYNNLSNCDDGCEWTDYCSRYRHEYLDEVTWLSGRNVGSTSTPLINQIDYNGETEYLLDAVDFAGWDDNWYRPNSNGYREHLDDFGF